MRTDYRCDLSNSCDGGQLTFTRAEDGRDRLGTVHRFNPRRQIGLLLEQPAEAAAILAAGADVPHGEGECNSTLGSTATKYPPAPPDFMLFSCP